MAMLPSVVAWKTPRTEEPGGLQSVGLQRVDVTERMNTFTITTILLFVHLVGCLHLVG